MARARMWAETHTLTAIIIVLVAAFVFGVAMIGIARATDQPSFCQSVCHEMQPYHAAWAKGPHADVSCVTCHVEPGTAARVSHKVEAMKEVWSHLTTESAFPLAEPTTVPDSRCVRCHSRIVPSDPNFDHASHTKRGACQSCHPSAGHAVTVEQLKSAGIYSGNVRAGARSDSKIAVIDGGSANIEGHKTITCSRCHDMAATGCASCHKPKHDQTGPAKKTESCTVCHKPGAAFVFTHPEDRKGCTDCHSAPGKNHDYAQACSTCHETGKSFAFRHPSSGACTECHQRPERHRKGACESCHKQRGKNWRFTHPGRGATCTTCHERPSGHRSGACTNCHKAGSSWRFTHPAGSSCTSCHSRPASHYGNSCRSCHTPGRSWRGATVRHGRIPGGEHTYRSFRCGACHPNGYSTHRCNTCHD